MSDNSNPIQNRSEILFLYDVKDANPNGDPNDENKPRMDEETGINIVTDVRLKRTIRDYLHEYKKMEIFVREIETSQGFIQDAKMRADDFTSEQFRKEINNKTLNNYKEEVAKNIIMECIDVRLFGATMPLEFKENNKIKTGSITYTGPVQFNLGRSLHQVSMMYMKGTGAFASGKEATQKTFREEYILPYSFIAFHGVINENAAKHSKMTEEDKKLLLEAIWNGTKNLISRSKFGHNPRLLFVIDYKEQNFFIGDLIHKIMFKSDKRSEEIRSINDFSIDISGLISEMEKVKDKIGKIKYFNDPGLKLMNNNECFDIDKLLFVPKEKLTF